MGNTIAEFVEKLKERLKNNQGNYNEHHSWCGNTEGGFYDTDKFDFDALMKEIDTFSEEFKSNKETPNAELTGDGRLYRPASSDQRERR